MKVEATGVTKLEKVLQPQALAVVFGASVAKVEDHAGLPVTTGIRMEPPVEGEWKWVGDTRLVFRPKSDWAAGPKYHFTLDRSLFPKHVQLERYEVDMQTASFVATMPKIEFYTDSTDPTVKQIVATLEFTHRVDMVALEKKLSLAMLGGADVFKKGAPRFTLTAGLHQRTAYLRTSALVLPEREDFMRVTLAKGLRLVQGSAETAVDIEKKVRVPDIASFFRIESVEGTVVRNHEGEPEQLLLIHTTGAAKSEDLQKALHVYLLPKKSADQDAEADEKKWAGPKKIDEEVLKKAVLLPIKLVPSGKENTDLHSFRISLETAGQLFVTIAKGVRPLGGFTLGEDYANVLAVPKLPREIEIQGQGGVFALNGERKLSSKSRGVRQIEYEIARGLRSLRARGVGRQFRRTPQSRVHRPHLRGSVAVSNDRQHAAPESIPAAAHRARLGCGDDRAHRQAAADRGAARGAALASRARRASSHGGRRPGALQHLQSHAANRRRKVAWISVQRPVGRLD